SRAFIFRQGPLSNARRAALTARSISGASPSATCAITSPFAGLMVSNVRPLTELTHFPSMSILVCRTRTSGRFARGAEAAMRDAPLDLGRADFNPEASFVVIRTSVYEWMVCPVDRTSRTTRRHRNEGGIVTLK